MPPWGDGRLRRPAVAASTRDRLLVLLNQTRKRGVGNVFDVDKCPDHQVDSCALMKAMSERLPHINDPGSIFNTESGDDGEVIAVTPTTAASAANSTPPPPPSRRPLRRRDTGESRVFIGAGARSKSWINDLYADGEAAVGDRNKSGEDGSCFREGRARQPLRSPVRQEHHGPGKRSSNRGTGADAGGGGRGCERGRADRAAAGGAARTVGSSKGKASESRVKTIPRNSISSRPEGSAVDDDDSCSPRDVVEPLRPIRSASWSADACGVLPSASASVSATSMSLHSPCGDGWSATVSDGSVGVAVPAVVPAEFATRRSGSAPPPSSSQPTGHPSGISQGSLSSAESCEPRASGGATPAVGTVSEGGRNGDIGDSSSEYAEDGAAANGQHIDPHDARPSPLKLRSSSVAGAGAGGSGTQLVSPSSSPPSPVIGIDISPLEVMTGAEDTGLSLTLGPEARGGIGNAVSGAVGDAALPPFRRRKSWEVTAAGGASSGSSGSNKIMPSPEKGIAGRASGRVLSKRFGLPSNSSSTAGITTPSPCLTARSVSSAPDLKHHPELASSSLGKRGTHLGSTGGSGGYHGPPRLGSASRLYSRAPLFPRSGPASSSGGSAPSSVASTPAAAAAGWVPLGSRRTPRHRLTRSDSIGLSRGSGRLLSSLQSLAVSRLGSGSQSSGSVGTGGGGGTGSMNLASGSTPSRSSGKGSSRRGADFFDDDDLEEEGPRVCRKRCCSDSAALPITLPAADVPGRESSALEGGGGGNGSSRTRPRFSRKFRGGSGKLLPSSMTWPSSFALAKRAGMRGRSRSPPPDDAMVSPPPSLALYGVVAGSGGLGPGEGAPAQVGRGFFERRSTLPTEPSRERSGAHVWITPLFRPRRKPGKPSRSFSRNFDLYSSRSVFDSAPVVSDTLVASKPRSTEDSRKSRKDVTARNSFPRGGAGSRTNAVTGGSNKREDDKNPVPGDDLPIGEGAHAGSTPTEQASSDLTILTTPERIRSRTGSPLNDDRPDVSEIGPSVILPLFTPAKPKRSRTEPPRPPGRPPQVGRRQGKTKRTFLRRASSVEIDGEAREMASHDAPVAVAPLQGNSSTETASHGTVDTASGDVLHRDDFILGPSTAPFDRVKVLPSYGCVSDGELMTPRRRLDPRNVRGRSFAQRTLLDHEREQASGCSLGCMVEIPSPENRDHGTESAADAGAGTASAVLKEPKMTASEASEIAAAGASALLARATAATLARESEYVRGFFRSTSVGAGNSGASVDRSLGSYVSQVSHREDEEALSGLDLPKLPQQLENGNVVDSPAVHRAPHPPGATPATNAGEHVSALLAGEHSPRRRREELTRRVGLNDAGVGDGDASGSTSIALAGEAPGVLRRRTPGPDEFPTGTVLQGHPVLSAGTSGTRGETALECEDGVSLARVHRQEQAVVGDRKCAYDEADILAEAVLEEFTVADVAGLGDEAGSANPDADGDQEAPRIGGRVFERLETCEKSHKWEAFTFSKGVFERVDGGKPGSETRMKGMRVPSPPGICLVDQAKELHARRLYELSMSQRVYTKLARSEGDAAKDTGGESSVSMEGQTLPACLKGFGVIRVNPPSAR